VATGDSAEAFLGTQGYQWDTQTDMFMCLTGSILSLIVFSRLQEKQISEMEKS
jgi:putative membrane protein